MTTVRPVARTPALFRTAVRLLLFGTLLATGCAVNPVTGKQQFVLMSEAQELQMGEEAYPVYTQLSEGLFPDPRLQEYVQSVGERLAGLSHRPGLPYRFNVVNDSAINAYALPGGKISITRGLLNKMENEAQLAAVLGHEIGHVTARHQAAGYTRQVLTGVLTQVGLSALESANVAGGDLLARGGMLAANLVLMKYSRDQERQSDDLGMEYLTAAGYNPQGLVQTMEILMAAHEREPSAVEALFASHPLSSERLATARQLAARQDPVLRSEARLRRQPFQQATQELRRVAPAYAKMDRGIELLAQDQGSEALAALEAATHLGPNQALIWAIRAAAEAKAGRIEESVRAAERAVELDPGLYRARFTAGVVTFEAGEHVRSLDHLAAADQLVPGQPVVVFFRGRNFEALGRQREAAEAYRAVLQSVQRGPMAQYSYDRLVEWGYLRPTQG